MTGLYVTLGAIGGLVGVFVAGMVIALAQGLRTGSATTLNEAEQAGVGIGIVLAGVGVGVIAAGLAHGIRWLWDRRFSGRDSQAQEPGWNGGSKEGGVTPERWRQVC